MDNKLGGLKLLPRDDRDFKVGLFVTLPKLKDLPKKFCLPHLTIKDQNADGNGDFCSAYATCGISEIQEGVPLYPELSFAASKFLSGEPEGWGQDARSAVASHVRFGAADSPAPNLTPKERRYFANYPEEYKQKALAHIKQSYVKVTGPYDAYDDIRATIWKFRKEKRAVAFGLNWNWDLENYYLTGTSEEGFGHLMYCVGWDEKGLICVNSAGKRAGRNGLHCISKETINHFVPDYGAYMFVDVSPGEIKYMIENNIKLSDNWLIGIYKALAQILKDFIKIKGQ